MKCFYCAIVFYWSVQPLMEVVYFFIPLWLCFFSALVSFNNILKFLENSTIFDTRVDTKLSFIKTTVKVNEDTV